MIEHRQWLKNRRKLLQQVKAQVGLRLGDLDRELARYSKKMESEYTGSWRVAKMKAMVQVAARSRVILFADFHAYAQSQKAPLRLLRKLARGQVQVLFLECLRPQDEAAAAQFLGGLIAESEFLEAIEWSKNWGFPWEHYRPLFEFARESGLEVRGLPRVRGSILARDQKMAQVIARRLSGRVGLVLVGEWHLADGHLPLCLRRHGLTELCVIFQDVEALYFRLARKRQEAGVEVLRGPRSRFCWMVSPPWVKWQSYLMFLEQTYDRELDDDLIIDYTDHIVSLVDLLAKDLNTQIRTVKLQVYCPNSNASLSKLRWLIPRSQEKILAYHFEQGLSFLLPKLGWMYLSRTTINHASSLAGQWIHAQISGRKNNCWDLPEDFLALIWIEAVGFFFSKWINPKRKADSLEAVRMQLQVTSPKDRGRASLLLALDHRLTQVVWLQTGRLRRSHFRKQSGLSHLEAARILGSMMGEKLFHQVRAQDISVKELMALLKISPDGESSVFREKYWQLIKRLEGKEAK